MKTKTDNSFYSSQYLNEDYEEDSYHAEEEDSPKSAHKLLPPNKLLKGSISSLTNNRSNKNSENNLAISNEFYNQESSHRNTQNIEIRVYDPSGENVTRKSSSNKSNLEDSRSVSEKRIKISHITKFESFSNGKMSNLNEKQNSNPPKTVF
jgi:hypothetical protein